MSILVSIFKVPPSTAAILYLSCPSSVIFIVPPRAAIILLFKLLTDNAADTFFKFTAVTSSETTCISDPVNVSGFVKLKSKSKATEFPSNTSFPFVKSTVPVPSE